MTATGSRYQPIRRTNGVTLRKRGPGWTIPDGTWWMYPDEASGGWRVDPGRETFHRSGIGVRTLSAGVDWLREQGHLPPKPVK